MSWTLFFQLMALQCVAFIFTIGVISHRMDKRREDAIKRKEAGLK